MAEKNVLRSFLVGLGFKIDDQEWKRFDTFWKKVGTRFVDISAQATIASLEIAAAVTSIADQLTNLYYVSQRTGTSVGGIQAFQFGAKQIGLTAEEATQSLEGLANAMRLQPGTRGVLAGLGIDPNQDKLQVLLKLVDVLRRMPYYQGAAIAQMFGIDEHTFFQLSKNFEQLKGAIDARQKMASAFGLNPQQLAEQSRQFHNDLDKIKERFEVLGMVLARDFLPVMEGAIRLFDRLLQMLAPLDAKTHGWSTRIISLATALLSVNRALAAGRWLLQMLGVGRGAATGLGAASAVGGAEGAAGAAGAAEAAGAAGLGAIALPALVVTAVGAALVWMQLHPDKVRAAAKSVWEGAKKIGSEVKQNLREAAPIIKAHPWQFVKQVASQVTGLNLESPQLNPKIKEEALQTVGVLKDKANLISQGIKNSLVEGLATIISKNEGFRDKRYWDVNGYSIGFGHHLKPGENYTQISREKGLQLLAQDISNTLAFIHSAVKTNLNVNQLKAVADLVFNIGTGNFNRSTLLKKLNAGDFAGAAEEFGRWNKVKTNGVYLADKGLTSRRAQEAELFRKKPDINLDQKVEIQINGSSDPQATAREVERRQSRASGQMIRQLAGVIDSPGAYQGVTP